MRLNITKKLILIIVVLVVTPILGTGLMANRAARGIVTQLLNESQIALTREIAEQVDELIRTAHADLKILSALPAISDYYYNRFYGLQAEAEICRKQIESFFLDVAKKSAFYYRIDYVDAGNAPIVNISEGRVNALEDPSAGIALFKDAPDHPVSQPSISSVLTIDAGRRRIIRFSYPLLDVWNHLSGSVHLELDFDRLSDYILSRRVGLKGYAFVLDTEGCIQVHPNRPFLGLRYDAIGTPPVADAIAIMLRERQGMISYEYQGSKVAAFTRVKENDWMVAVTLPESEFAERVNIIGQRVLVIMILAASFAAGVGIIFSWHFVKPIKALVTATNVIAKGDLPSQMETTSNDELGILTRAFNHMVRNLRQVQAELVQSEKLVSLGRLATGVAHEIRNPLNSMKVAAEILSHKQPSKEEAQELVGLIEKEITHMDTFVTDFLSYARQPSPSFIDSDINQFIEEVIETIETRIRNGHITLSRVMAPELPLVRMDPFQMERALLNILINAIEAMPEGGRLRISTSCDAYAAGERRRSFIRIIVSDSGIGLSPEQIQQVFDPFFSTKDHGTGLGLSLTKSIVEAHGGSIAIEANPDAGVTVRISLPDATQEIGDNRAKAAE